MNVVVRSVKITELVSLKMSKRYFLHTELRMGGSEGEPPRITAIV
jgi:hypothetical protein